MPIVDPHMAEILRFNVEMGLAPLETMTAVEARAEAEARNRVWNEENPPVGRVEDVDLPGPGGTLRLRIYEPKAAPASGPAVLFIHGGGWVICSLDTHDGVCRRIANKSGLRVASLDYRLAPEHPFPAPLEDCLAAFAWLRLHGSEVRIDSTRLALAGDLAGANLALATCLALKQRVEMLPQAAALIYGAYSADLDSPSHRAFGDDTYGLSTPTMHWFWDQYVPEKSRRADPLVSPLNADLAGMPPLYVSAAELDPLRDDSERIAAKLALAGVDFDYRLWRGVTHACFMMSRKLPAADSQVAEVADFLRRRLAS